MSTLTCSNGISIIASTAFLVSRALTLKSENGAHVGMCLDSLFNKEIPEQVRKTARLIKGKKSTIFAAAELASVVRVPARSADHVEKMK